MYKFKAVLFFVFTVLTLHSAAAQNNTNSPYTRFGYGDISNNNNGEQRGMGGVSTAIRSNKSISTANPASYTSIDSTTFMFDVGVSAMASRFSDSNGQKNSINGNLEYLTLQLPLGKYVGFSAGVLPYSFVGYNTSESDSIAIPGQTNSDGDDQYTKWQKSYYGQGGISEVYAGLSVELFKHVSLGVNAYYMFGSINNYRKLSFDDSNSHSTSMLNTLNVGTFRFRYGLQAYHTFAQKHTLTVGATFENRSKLNGSFLQVETVSYDTVSYVEDGFELPMNYSVGLAYTYNNRLTVAVDYAFEEWAKANYFGKTDSLLNRTRMALGVEYVHNPIGKRYVDRMRFRVGANLSDPYTMSENTFSSKNVGVSCGIGFPLRNTNTMINTAFEYNKKGSRTTLREDYFKFTLNATINENWFFKRKL